MHCEHRFKILLYQVNLYKVLTFSIRFKYIFLLSTSEFVCPLLYDTLNTLFKSLILFYAFILTLKIKLAYCKT